MASTVWTHPFLQLTFVTFNLPFNNCRPVLNVYKREVSIHHVFIKLSEKRGSFNTFFTLVAAANNEIVAVGSIQSRVIIFNLYFI